MTKNSRFLDFIRRYERIILTVIKITRFDFFCNWQFTVN